MPEDFTGVHQRLQAELLRVRRLYEKQRQENQRLREALEKLYKRFWDIDDKPEKFVRAALQLSRADLMEVLSRASGGEVAG